MTRQDKWKLVLEAEMRRWSTLTYAELIAGLKDVRAYEIAFESGQYQVEVELLESTQDHVRVMVSVDDGSLPASIRPATGTFVVSVS